MADASVLQVVIFREGTLVGTEVFLPGEYAVGSDPGCELVLTDEVVGRCAAFLSFREGKITLQDGGAGGGVSINGEAKSLSEVRALDDVAIGPFLLKFRIVGQKRPGAPARPAAPAPTKPAAPAAAMSRAVASVPAPVARSLPPDDREVTVRATLPEVLIPPAAAPAPTPRAPEPPPARSSPRNVALQTPIPRSPPAPKPLMAVQTPAPQPAPRLPTPAPAPVPVPVAAPRPEGPVPLPAPVAAPAAHVRPAAPAGRSSGSSLDIRKKGRNP
ncbi:MAG: hypothetical protein HY901_06295, partial [Deltaproteobacteria bacterium]|nr:hypothetical protein [Deltaproteobacteria bacterium]